MKLFIKLICICALFVSFHGGLLHVYGEDCTDPKLCTAEEGGNTPTLQPGEGDKTVKITVTEKVPGVPCTGVGEMTSEDNYTRYECIVPLGWSPVLAMLGRMIRFLTAVSLIGAVLFLVFNGIHLSMSGIDPEAKGKVKGRIMMTLGGIVLLLLSGPLLTMIAPWIYK